MRAHSLAGAPPRSICPSFSKQSTLQDQEARGRRAAPRAAGEPGTPYISRGAVPTGTNPGDEEPKGRAAKLNPKRFTASAEQRLLLLDMCAPNSRRTASSFPVAGA